MNRLLISQRHPADGYFEIYQNADKVTVRCKWPFDVAADDWIEIQNAFKIADYASAVALAQVSGRGEAPGIEGGSIVIEASPAGAAPTIVKISNSAHGWAAKSLRLHISRPVKDLVPVNLAGHGRTRPPPPNPTISSPAPTNTPAMSRQPSAAVSP